MRTIALLILLASSASAWAEGMRCPPGTEETLLSRKITSKQSVEVATKKEDGAHSSRIMGKIYAPQTTDKAACVLDKKYMQTEIYEIGIRFDAGRYLSSIKLLLGIQDGFSYISDDAIKYSFDRLTEAMLGIAAENIANNSDHDYFHEFADNISVFRHSKALENKDHISRIIEIKKRNDAISKLIEEELVHYKLGKFLDSNEHGTTDQRELYNDLALEFDRLSTEYLHIKRR